MAKQQVWKNGERFRSERQVATEIDQLKILIGNEVTGEVTDWSRTGIGFNAEVNLNVGDEIDQLRITYFDYVIFEGKIRIARTTPNKFSRFGAELVSDILHLEKVQAIKKIVSFKKEDEELSDFVAEINADVCKVIIKLRTYLVHLTEVCDSCEKSWAGYSYDKRYEVESTFLKNMATLVTEKMRAFSAEVDGLVKVDSQKSGSVYHKIFEREITPFLITSSLAWRAYTKPRNYAGDYEMMNQMYRNGFEGTNLVGKLLHHWAANEVSSNTVKFRRELFASEFTRIKNANPKQQIVSLSVAAGPAKEVQDCIETWKQSDLDRWKFVLLDLDSEALEHAQTEIKRLSFENKKTVNLEFLNESVREIIKGNLVLPPSDFIYSAGLFDYIDNQVSKVLFERLFAMLKIGGRMIIGNYTHSNPSKGLCSFAADWNLIHKSEQDMLDWCADIGDADIKIIHDPTNINAFLIVDR